MDMQNITLCMRTWREVRNFASQKVPLTMVLKNPKPSQSTPLPCITGKCVSAPILYKHDVQFRRMWETPLKYT